MRLRDAMRDAAERARRVAPPERYRWIAVWWRLHARESADPATCWRYSRNQRRLYRDMLSRPEHYTSWMRPSGVTDWQWSGLAA
jgi:hypothetical protein